jgi:hypothetical protein
LHRVIHQLLRHVGGQVRVIKLNASVDHAHLDPAAAWSGYCVLWVVCNHLCGGSTSEPYEHVMRTRGQQLSLAGGCPSARPTPVVLGYAT